MVYSHDTFGLGNIRRMLAVSNHLLGAIPGVSVLLVTGSPMIQEFRIRPGLDYIKLPCLSRTGRGEYSAKSLGTGIDRLLQLRSGLILAAARDFAPDVVLIDKKPDGVKHELRHTLDFLKHSRPHCRIGLVLRDILDCPASTITSWHEGGYFNTLRQYFDGVLVLGDPTVFDAAAEYRFPEDIRSMTSYCGYIRHHAPASRDTSLQRARFLVNGEKHLVLVTPGGGEDGFALVRCYAEGSAKLRSTRSVIVCGPEMPASQRESIAQIVARDASVSVAEFTGEMLGHMAAADCVVSMAGYNTMCEVLSLRKGSVTCPRVHPVQEQWIRGERLSTLGLTEAIHPGALTPDNLMRAVSTRLDSNRTAAFPASLDGLDNIAAWIRESALPVAKTAPLGRLAWNAV
ncbi:glycosyl transferase [Bryobacterales bacterium F-183]|nr:glycosyl transferase [Bryobacterales bacterium F-183]